MNYTKVKGVRNTVTISFSCKPETYKKIMDLKEALEAERLTQVPISHVIDRLVNLGFAYREVLKVTPKQTELPLNQTELITQ